MRLVLTVGFIFALAMAAPGLVRAQEGSAVEDDAKVLFDRGREAFHAGRYSDAAEAFREAFEKKRTWKLLYNLGQAEAASKRYGLALEVFERYLAEGGDEVPEERAVEVLSEVRRFRDMVGALEVRAPGGAVVVVDDVERGRMPLAGALMVAAGVEHRIVVTGDGGVLLDRVVRVSGGQEKVIDMDAATPEDAPAGDPEPEETEAPEEEESPRLSPLFWIGAAGTLASGIVAGVLWGVMSSKVDDYDGYRGDYLELDGASPEYDEDEARLYGKMDDARSDVDKYNKAAIGVTVLAGTLLGATIVVLAADLAREPEEDNRAEVDMLGTSVVVRF